MDAFSLYSNPAEFRNEVNEKGVPFLKHPPVNL
jgi:hypothetical protein